MLNMTIINLKQLFSSHLVVDSVSSDQQILKNTRNYCLWKENNCNFSPLNVIFVLNIIRTWFPGTPVNIHTAGFEEVRMMIKLSKCGFAGESDKGIKKETTQTERDVHCKGKNIPREFPFGFPGNRLWQSVIMAGLLLWAQSFLAKPGIVSTVVQNPEYERMHGQKDNKVKATL